MIAQQPRTSPGSDATADNLAYVIYTSGSTGTPKGAMNTHRAIANRLRWMQDAYQLTAADQVLQKTPYSFDVSVWEFFWPLISGARLVLARPGGHRDPAYLAGLIDAQCITTLHFVPSMLQAFLQAPDLSGCASLRRVICSGEALAFELQERFFARLAPRLHNLYGPTEAAVDVTAWACDPALVERVVPIGRPIANTQIYLLDGQVRPVPIGVVGELYIGGVQLARGYLNRPDLTAERFVPNPFAKVSGGGSQVSGVELSDTRYPIPDTRLYKTGDLARYREDGAIEYLGRIDQQVKLRGFRVEPGEVEAALRAHPAVLDAAVIAQRDGAGDGRLVAYVVPMREQGTGDRGQENVEAGIASLSPVTCHLSPVELRGFLTARLPDYMVPAAIMLLEAMPLTPSGKLDRRMLPAPEPARPDLAEPFAAPRTPEEEVVAGIWADVLHLDRVGVHDHFFDLGGHSLMATQVISRLRETFAGELTLRDLFDAPTPARLTERILIAQRSSAGQLPPPLRPAPRDRPLPLSFAQQRLWFLDQLEPNSTVYNIPSVMRLSGPLDVAVLRGSLGELLRRHESLRTTFALLGGQPVQRIAPPYPLPLPLIDLRALPDAEREAEVLRLAAREDQQPFELLRGPLLRATLLRLSEHEHVALLTMHHIISDGWSLGIFIRELSSVYAAFVEGRPSPLPELALQYADYAVWQRAWLQGAVLESHLAYWQSALADLSPLELPLDKPRPASPSFAGAAREFMLSKQLHERLALLSRREGVTLFMTLLAAFQVLLARYSDQEDVVVGTPVAGRTWAETEGLIGCFINTLVLRADLSGNPTVRELLRRVREVCLGAYAHQDLPFEQVVDALAPDRDLSRHPLFQVLFSLQNAPANAVELTDLALRPMLVERRTTQFDLSLFVEETAHGLAGLFEYSTDLFLPGTITRMLGHLEALLAGMAAAPDARLADLPLLSAAERQQLLCEWNDTTTEVRSQKSEVRRSPPDSWLLTPDSSCVHELFEAQAARTPDAIAVVFDGTTNDQRPTTNDECGRGEACLARTHHLTYAALNVHADQMARTLRARGVERETLVAVCLERSPALVVALLGILKAGAAYLPLDPRYPEARRAFMLNDSGATLLIATNGEERTTNDELGHLVTLSPWHLIRLDADAPTIARQPDTNPQDSAAPDQLAYVIYTSGSTGVPKGVQISHRALVNFLRSMREQPGLSADDVLLAVTTLAFDIAGLEIYLPLIAGARLVISAQETALDSLALIELMRRSRATVMQATPTTWQLLFDAGWRGDARLRALCGGEALPPELARRLSGKVAALWNLYGPTETTIWSMACALDSRDDLVTIGRPIANTRLYVLDARLRLVPIGALGELYIGGAGLARGYLGRPDLTATAFVPNPFSQGLGARGQESGVRSQESEDVRCPEGARTNDEGRTTNDESSHLVSLSPCHLVTDGTRLYKTGDLARYLPDGRLVFVGRRDGQIKLRGYRIELGEVAAALRRHPAVQTAAVQLREDAPGQKRLVAYIVQGSGVRSQESEGPASETLIPDPRSLITELRAFLAERLPAYMLPSAFVLLEALPLTPNGKLDHKALPAPEVGRATLAQAFVAPRTPGESILAELWERLLRRSPIGVHDNFFALGGDSILGLQVIAAARERGLVLTPKQLFQHQTIGELATVAGSAAIVAEQGRVRGVVPLTPVQQAFFEQRLAHPEHYNQALLLRLRQRLAPAVLAGALRALLEQHDALRLRYERGEQGWRQYHAEEVKAEVQYVDLRGVAVERQSAALEGAAAALQGSLELSGGPLLRLALFELGGGQDPRLLLIVHHLVVDGVSWRVLLEDLYRAATHLAAGQPVQLPPKTTSYQAWAERLLSYARSEQLLAERAYWRALAQQAGPALPRDYPGGLGLIGSARELAGRLSVEETAALLGEVAAAYHTQINDALLSALAQALGEWSGEARLLLELEGHGREDLFEDIDLSRTVGWFTTLYPVLLDLRGVRDPGAALLAVKEQLRAIPNRGIGYGLLRYLASDADEREELAVRPEVSFNYLGQVEAGAQGSGGLFGAAQEDSGPEQAADERRGHVLEVSAVVEGGQLELVLRYSPELHAQASIERLLAGYLAALRALLAHSAAPDAGGFSPSDFPLANLNDEKLSKLSALLDKLDSAEE